MLGNATDELMRSAATTGGLALGNNTNELMPGGDAA
jgi:hypothetical protein